MLMPPRIMQLKNDFINTLYSSAFCPAINTYTKTTQSTSLLLIIFITNITFAIPHWYRKWYFQIFQTIFLFYDFKTLQHLNEDLKTRAWSRVCIVVTLMLHLTYWPQKSPVPSRGSFLWQHPRTTMQTSCLSKGLLKTIIINFMNTI